MSVAKIILRSLIFYWRTNLGVLLSAIVSTGILTGALAIGDSVRHSLRMQAAGRLGKTELALSAGSRFFRAELADELATQLNTEVAPVFQVRGLVSDSTDTKRANIVQVLGVDERFFQIGPSKSQIADRRSQINWTDGIIVNDRLAARLGAGAGDEVVLRIAKPGPMSRDVPIAPDSDMTSAWRLVVKAVADRSEFGSFSLQANQITPFNAFVPIRWLQDKLDHTRQANMLLVAANPDKSVTLEKANTAVCRCWKLADAGLELRRLDAQKVFELRSKRIFIDEPVADTAMNAGEGAVGILTYFANQLRCGDKTTPYSMVTAISPPAQIELGTMNNEFRNSEFLARYSIFDGMPDDEILINQWLAEDLQAKVGDSIELTYFVIGSGRKLQEQESTFRVRGVLPMQPDPELMPDFPGLAEVDNCRDWDRGIPIDLNKIRTPDEDYWDRYRGTPKAFISLATGQKLWASRFGSLTAVRYPFANFRFSIADCRSEIGNPKSAFFNSIGTLCPVRSTDCRLPIVECRLKIENRQSAFGNELAGPLEGNSAQAIADKLTASIDPASVGLFFQPVRRHAMEAVDKATDFSQLFLGLSMFLIVAALILMGLIFVFGVESRSEQIGMLRAVGFSPKLVRRLLLIEGGTLAVVGAIAGSAAGLLYTGAMIYGLATGWQGAVGGSAIEFYAKPFTLLVGAVISVAISLITIWLTSRKQLWVQPRELLAGNLRWQFFVAGSASRSRLALSLAAITAIAAVVLVVSIGSGDSGAVSAVFFAAGALLLAGGLCLTAALLRIVAVRSMTPAASLFAFGLRNSTRRSGRSLAVVGLLAFGTFLVIAVGANRNDPLARANQRDSGTGGFALFGESAVPILYDLNSRSSRQRLGLDPNQLQGVSVVQLRLHEADDASCLNLNRAVMPGLLGVAPEELDKRGAFVFRRTIESRIPDRKSQIANRKRWSFLLEDSQEEENVVPAIGDYPTIVWSLGKSIGDELEYADELGGKFRLRIVAILTSSILQGRLLISQSNFTQRFPSEEGYRVFLIDAPHDRAEGGPRLENSKFEIRNSKFPPEAGSWGFSGILSARLKDSGLALTPATDRLAEFSAVENTYLSIFQLLGGLGLILGTVGLALVVLRNMLDRRGELAMLRAIGFSKAAVGRMAFYEHWLLCLWGLICGVTAALVAVKPAVSSPGAQIPYFSLVLIVAAIALASLVWIRLATAFALSGNMLDALRNE